MATGSDGEGATGGMKWSFSPQTSDSNAEPSTLLTSMEHSLPQPGDGMQCNSRFAIGDAVRSTRIRTV